MNVHFVIYLSAISINAYRVGKISGAMMMAEIDFVGLL